MGVRVSHPCGYHHDVTDFVLTLQNLNVMWIQSEISHSKYALHYNRYFTVKCSKYMYVLAVLLRATVYCTTLSVQNLLCTTAASMVTPKQVVAILFMLVFKMS